MKITKLALVSLLVTLIIFGIACGTTTYQLTTVIQGQGNVSPSSGKFTANSVITLIANPASGWLFNSWGGASTGSQNTITITMDSDKQIYAYFATPTPTPTPRPTYSLTISSSPSSGGTITRNDNGPYYYGDVVQITASPNNYYEFDYWSGDASGNQITKSVTITKNTYIYAYFELKDSDNDGLSDKEEDEIGSNPYVQDTDSDGILDGSDLWPTKDMKVRVSITQFTEVQQTCDPLGDSGDPYFNIQVGSLSTQIVHGWTGSADFNIADNIQSVSVHIEAWDGDGGWSSDDQYDISSSSSSQSLSETFNRGSGPSTATTTTTVTGSGNLNSGCPASITFQIKNLY